MRERAALLGWPFGWNSKKTLTAEHRSQTYQMLDQFDLVGLTSRFDEFLMLLAREAGLPYPMYRRMNDKAGGATGGSAVFAQRRKERLQNQTEVKEATMDLTSFDATVYAHYAKRFEARVAAEGAQLASLVVRFHAASATEPDPPPAPPPSSAQQQPAASPLRTDEQTSILRKLKLEYGNGMPRSRPYFVGGLPPSDGYLVTSDYLCKNRMQLPGFFPDVDYGGCVDHGPKAKGAPKRLDELKRYVPCSAANCTKIAAEGLACRHAWRGAGDAAVAYGSTHPFGKRSVRGGDEGGSTPLCKVESAPDGFF